MNLHFVFSKIALTYCQQFLSWTFTGVFTKFGLIVNIVYFMCSFFRTRSQCMKIQGIKDLSRHQKDGQLAAKIWLWTLESINFSDCFCFWSQIYYHWSILSIITLAFGLILIQEENIQIYHKVWRIHSSSEPVTWILNLSEHDTNLRTSKLLFSNRKEFQ